MLVRLASFALLTLTLPSSSFGQDTTIASSDFESGIPPAWGGVGTGPGQWHVLAAGECGAVTQMATPSAGGPTCNYAGLAALETLQLPQSALSTLTHTPGTRLTFDYILEVDAIGDRVLGYFINTSNQIVFTDVTSRLVNDGQLHQIVIEFPLGITAFGISGSGLALYPDGIGDQGRGLLIDNLRYSYSSTGAIYCPEPGMGACPCAGAASVFGGCRNSAGKFGALRGSGNPSVSNDSYQLDTFDTPTSSPTFFFAGTSAISMVFGDGVLCAGGGITRLGVKSATLGMAAFPVTGQPRLSTLMPIAAGSTQYYQAMYRDTAGPCGSGANLTNGWKSIWQP